MSATIRTNASNRVKTLHFDSPPRAPPLSLPLSPSLSLSLSRSLSPLSQSLSLSRSGEAWAALGAEYLLTVYLSLSLSLSLSLTHTHTHTLTLSLLTFLSALCYTPGTGSRPASRRRRSNQSPIGSKEAQSHANQSHKVTSHKVPKPRQSVCHPDGHIKRLHFWARGRQAEMVSRLPYQEVGLKWTKCLMLQELHPSRCLGCSSPDSPSPSRSSRSSPGCSSPE